MTKDEALKLAQQAGVGDAMAHLHAPAFKRFADLLHDFALASVSQPEQEPVNPLDDKTIAALIEASGIELDDDHVLEDQTIYYVDASTLFGLVRKVEKMFQPRMSTYTTPPQRPWVGLTDDEILAIGKELGVKCRLGGNQNIDFDYARAIEARLKEKNT